jgi:hypothetical protein
MLKICTGEKHISPLSQRGGWIYAGHHNRKPLIGPADQGEFAPGTDLNLMHIDLIDLKLQVSLIHLRKLEE